MCERLGAGAVLDAVRHRRSCENFSLFIRPGGRYQLTPLYDVLSAYPVLGEGSSKISPHKSKLAMAVRTKNAHWRTLDIMRWHWLELGTRHGVVTADGRPAQAVVDDLVARTPEALAVVRARLPHGFPAEVADSILGGVQDAAARLAA
jgi:serine/threonine-protein kinase HipA